MITGKNKYFLFDYRLLIYTVILSLLGILFAYSSNIRMFEVPGSIQSSYIRQIFFFATGLIMLWIISVVNYKKIAEHSNIIFILCIGVLLYTLVFGKIVNNSRRWISLGVTSIQPSEFVKIAMIIVIANYLDVNRARMQSFLYIIGLFLIVCAPIFLIFLQPDLGTAIVFIPVTMVMLFVGGVNLKYFLGILLMGLIAASIPIALTYSSMTQVTDNVFIDIISNKNYILFLASFFFLSAVILFAVNLSMRNLLLNSIAYFCIMIFIGLLAALIIQSVLKPYQMERLLAFIDPQIDKWDLGYNVIQSEITIGSGGFWGKGLFNGTQGQLGFLPSRSTDFIFSVIGEETGFIGSAIVLLIFFLFISRLIKIAKSVKDYLGGLIVVGILTMFIIQIFINIGMTIGVAPVTGLPLPFVTYGGSTLWTSLIAIGLILNVEIRKYVHAT